MSPRLHVWVIIILFLNCLCSAFMDLLRGESEIWRDNMIFFPTIKIPVTGLTSNSLNFKPKLLLQGFSTRFHTESV